MCPNCKLLTFGEYNISILFMIFSVLSVIGFLGYVILKNK
jgi:hypothetical protein